MKDKSILSSIGIIIFFILTAIDKIIIKLPDIIYVIVGLLSIILIIIGFLKDNRKIKKSKKIKTILIATLITIILTIIYINPILIYNNLKFTNHLKRQLNNKIITNISPFEYDKICIIYPYTSKEEISKIIGLKSRYITDNNVNDNITQIIIIKDKKIIAQLQTPSRKLNSISIDTTSDNNCLTNKKDSYLYNVKVDNKINNLIEIPLKKEENYNSITFTIPGLWWKEDSEGERFYYLDIEENINNLLVSKINDFNYQKYKKNIKDSIIEEKKETINNNQTYYLVTKKDSNFKEIEYIITIKEETYSFKLYTSNETFTEHNKELQKTIESIKLIK